MKEEPDPRPQTPSQLSIPAFLMNFPFTVSCDVPNNVWMNHNDSYDYNKTFSQFMDLYKYVSQHALVYLLPHNHENLQDLVFVANLGCYLPHIPDRQVMLLSNYKSTPRVGEARVGRQFFESMRYEVHQPTCFWEGEADIKYIRDNIYVAGYGIRTDVASYYWMQAKFDMDIVLIQMSDNRLYHFDCMFCPLDSQRALAVTKQMFKSDVKKLEKVVDVIDIPEEYIYNGWTNNIIINNKILRTSDSPESPMWKPHTERDFEKFVSRLGLEPVVFKLWEFEKSGGDLSCLFLSLNYVGRGLASSNSICYITRNG